MMRIKYNNLQKFICFLRWYYKECERTYKDKKIYIDILKEPYINKRKNIIKNNFEYGSVEYNSFINFFSNPYLIFISNYEDFRDNNMIEWDESIYDMSEDKLYNILKKNKKKYLRVINNCGGWIGDNNLISIIESHELV